MKRWILVYIFALVIRVAIALPLMHDWDGFVFTQSAKNMLHGITPYQTVQSNSPVIYPDSDRPMTEQWYGYPPLPLLMFTIPYGVFSFFGITNPLFLNLAIKLPFILGDLFCAYLIKKLLSQWNQRLANRAALLVLFNPLLIWVSSAWGMFDIWIVNFLLLFLLSLRSQKVIWAGIFLALMPQIKLFPLFFLPALVVFCFQTVTERTKRVQLLGAFFLTTILIDIPFFLTSPQGFMNQNLLMHLARPAQGIGILAILDYLANIYRFPIALFVQIGSLLTLASIAFFNIFSFAYVKTHVSRLLTIVFLIYTSTLLFNKVVNEQYYVVLVGLLILLTHFPRRESILFSKGFLRIFETLATFLVLIAGVVLGFHFLTFLPPFITDGVLKTSSNYLVFYFSRLIPQLPLYTYPNSLWTYYNAPVTITYLLMLPLIIYSAIVVIKGFITAYKMKTDIAKTFILHVSLPTLTSETITIATITLFFAIILSFTLGFYLKTTNALTLVDLVHKQTVILSPLPQPKPKVGIFYNVWWNNPSHIPTLADDSWNKTSLTPIDGYYTSKNSYFVQHITQMQQAGIDFAMVSYHMYDRERFLTFTKYADQMNFSYVPMIESDDALSTANLRPIDPSGNPTIGYKVSPDSKTHMETEIISAMAEIKNNPGMMHINGKPVVSVYDGHFYLPSWDSDSKKMLAERIYQQYASQNRDPFPAISQAWGIPVHSISDMVAQYPTDIHTFNNSNKTTAKVSNNDYKLAFLFAFNEYWKGIKSDVQQKVGPIYLMSTYQTPLLVEADSVVQQDDIALMHTFDNEFYYSLSNTWSYWKNVKKPESILSIWDEQETQQTVRDRANDWPVFLTVTPTYKDTNVRGKLGFVIPATVGQQNIYNWTWQTAMKNKPDYILIASWNEFFEGSAIQPSKEYGTYYLDATKQYTDVFKKETFAEAQ